MYQIFQKLIIGAYLNSKRLKWASHIWSSKGIANRVFFKKLNRKRTRGRPRQTAKTETNGEKWLRQQNSDMKCKS